MPTTVKIQLNNTDEILKARHLETNGLAQLHMTNEIFKLSDEYVPFDNHNLGELVKIEPSSITYNSPYARYQWFGVAMESNPRKATDRPLKYQGAPKRGKEWVTRCWIDRKSEILQSVANFVGGRVE